MYCKRLTPTVRLILANAILIGVLCHAGPVFAAEATTDHYFVVPAGADTKTLGQVKKDLNVQETKPLQGFPDVEVWTLTKPPDRLPADLGSVAWLGQAKGRPDDLFASVVAADSLKGSGIPSNVQKRIANITKSAKGPVRVVTFDVLTAMKLSGADGVPRGAAGPNGMVLFNANLGQRETLILKTESTSSDPAGGTLWSGSLRSGEAPPPLPSDAPVPEKPEVGEFGLSHKDGIVFGQVKIEGTRYSIQPVGSNYHVLVPMDWSSYPEGHPVLERRSPGKGKHVPEAPRLAFDAGVSPSCTGPLPNIRIGFVFTKQALKDLNYSSVNDPIAIAWVRQVVGSLSEAFSVAVVPVAIESAGTFLYTGNEALNVPDAWGTLLSNLKKNPAVTSFRRRNSADLIVMIAHLQNSGGCGASPMYLMTGEAKFGPANGYSLVSSLGPCPDPAYLTVTHEIGHLLGLAHDQDALNPPTTSVIDPEARGFAAVTGTSVQQSKVTVEGYPSSCARKIIRLHPELTQAAREDLVRQACERVARWSNSGPDPVDGQIGQAGDADSARVLPTVVRKVCAYKSQL